MSVVTDRRRLYLAAFLRAVATGLVGVVLGIHLAAQGAGVGTLGVLVTAGLTGAAVAAAVVTLGAERLPIRGALIGLAVLSAAGGLGVALSSHPSVLAIAAFVGMVNGMGRDRGASLALEQAALAATADAPARTSAFARYNVVQDAGHAIGSFLAGLPALLATPLGGEPPALRATVGLYALLSLLPAAAYLGLSQALVHRPTAARGVSPETRPVLLRLAALAGLDSLAGGFLTSALLAYFFHERFGVGLGVVGPLFAAARVANAASHLGAAWLARRYGLVNTMVFTHIPSSLLLVTVALAPTFPVAAALFLLREGLVEMDVPTRQSYIMAVVRPEERAFAAGLTSLVRLGAWSVGPLLSGALMAGLSLWAPLLAASAMKIGYDLLLYRAFRHLRPPEER
jgi:MFS family permease